MNMSSLDDHRFQFITTGDVNHLLVNSIDEMATEQPPYANGCPSTYHISSETHCALGEASAVNGNHEASLVPMCWQCPTQLKLVHGGMELYVGEYPIQLLSEVVASEPSNGANLHEIAVSDDGAMEIVSTKFKQQSTIDRLTATALDGTNSLVKHIPNQKKCGPCKSYGSKPCTPSQRTSNISARAVPFTKRQADTNCLPSTTASKQSNLAIQKNNFLNIHQAFKRSHNRAIIKPLQLAYNRDKQATVYKVVFPGKVDGRFLLTNICGTERKTASIGMPQPMLQNPIKRAPDVSVQETKSSSSKRRARTNHVLNNTGVQTRSGRLSKPPQAFIDGFASDNHDQQYSSCEGNTIQDVHFPLEKTNENPENYIAKYTPSAVRRKAKVQPQFQCGTCSKIFLGRRMARHLNAYPTHITLDKMETCKTKDAIYSTPVNSACTSPTPVHQDPSLSPPTQLYRLLVDLVTAPATESNQRSVLLGEISQFVGLVRSRVPSLIVPSEQEDNETVYVDRNVADVLQLNPGNYRIRMDAFVQEREKFLHIGDTGSGKSGSARTVSDAVDQDKDSDSVNVSSTLNCELTAVTSFEALLQDFAELEQREQQGLLAHLPLPLPIDRNENENVKTNLETLVPAPVLAAAPTACSEPAVISNQGTTAFGRLCQLSEELFPSQSQEVLQAFEELTNLSELCSPQVLGVPGGTVANESPSALAFD